LISKFVFFLDFKLPNPFFSHSTKASGCVFLTTQGEALLLYVRPFFAKTADELGENTVEILKGLPFWNLLKDRISFLMSDSSR